MTDNISILMVFSAGLLSFFSPCILPLIPSYFGILAGTGLNPKDGGSAASGSTASADAVSGGAVSGARGIRLLRASFGFILGFSAVFIAMGLLINSVFFLLGNIITYINIAAGIIVIVLGLNIIFDFISFLNYEKRPFLNVLVKPRNTGSGQITPARPGVIRGLAGAFLGGAAFASGWTPCIGPVLTSVLLLANQSGRTMTAVFYLAIYSAGLGVPFFACAVFANLFLRAGSKIYRYFPVIRRISGILLIIIGIMIITGKYSALGGYLAMFVSK